MQGSSRFTRLSAFVSLLGTLLIIIGFFCPILLTYPPLDNRFPNPYPPILDGRAMLHYLFSFESNQHLPLLQLLLFALLMMLALITLGATLPVVLSKATVSGGVGWIRTLAALLSLLVLIWFLGGVFLLNFHMGFGPSGIGATSPRFEPGFGITFLLIGTVLSALGLGRIGIGAIVGAGVGSICLLTPLSLITFLVCTLTCILGTLVGIWMQRASLKETLTVS